MQIILQNLLRADKKVLLQLWACRWASILSHENFDTLLNIAKRVQKSSKDLPNRRGT